MEEFLKEFPEAAKWPANIFMEELQKWQATKEDKQRIAQKQEQEDKERQAKQTPATTLLNKIGPKTDLVIGDKTFTICHWSPTKVYRNIPKIGKFFVVPLSTIMGEILNTPEGEKPDFSEALPSCLQYLFYTLEENDIMKFYDVVFEDVIADNLQVSSNFDDVFAENPFGALELVAKVLEVNYIAPFSQNGGSQALSKLLKAAAPMTQISRID